MTSRLKNLFLTRAEIVRKETAKQSARSDAHLAVALCEKLTATIGPAIAQLETVPIYPTIATGFAPDDAVSADVGRNRLAILALRRLQADLPAIRKQMDKKLLALAA